MTICNSQNNNNATFATLWSFTERLDIHIQHNISSCPGKIFTIISNKTEYCVCDNHSILVNSISLVATCIGLILNAAIIARFCSRQEMRKRIPNILLAHQAFVDVVNLVAYVAPSAVVMIYISEVNKITLMTVFKMTAMSLNSLQCLTGYSSVGTFTLVACERWLAIWKPFRHRTHVKISRVTKVLVAIWVITIAVSILRLMLSIKQINTHGHFRRSSTSMLGILLVFITIVLGMSYIKALVSVRQHPGNQTSHHKEVRLAAIFCLMYALFLLLSVSILFAIWTPMFSLANHINILAFAITSIINPVLTISMAEDFQWNAKRRKCSSGETEDSISYTTNAIIKEVATINSVVCIQIKKLPKV